MSRKRDVLMVIVALAAGLVGGVVSSELLRGAPIFAQKAPQVGKVLQAERFEVVDQAGKARAALGMAPDGRPDLTLYDEAEKVRAVLGLLSNGEPRLGLSDQAGKRRAVLGTASDGSPILLLYDGAEKVRASLGTASDGGPAGLVLVDQAGKTRAALFVASDGSPSLMLYDEVEKMRAALRYTELEAVGTGATENRAVSSLMLFDKDGKVIWQAP